MKIFICANEQQKKELLSIKLSEKNNFIISTKYPETSEYKTFDAYFILDHFSDFRNFDLFENKPVIINEVIQTLADLSLPHNFHRMNAWQGFLEREIWEVVSKTPEKIIDVLHAFNRKIIFVKDEPGFVSARVISMIINEAFFALGENVSTKEEIDLAMKSGTNYPYGPFEWAEKIGVGNILNLLEKLSEKEERYFPAPSLRSFFYQDQNLNL
ncbi:MAG: 3-hydroxyacyl-CoA dehydrogenase family protein [Ginsengibacter sp.]